MNYQSALEYLYELTDYEKERIARYDPATLDLSRVQRVLARLGNPHQRFPSIHIAGTKGKGSVAATCASVLHAAGLRTGLYTSPHLHTFRERIQVNRELIPPDVLAGLVEESRPVLDTEPELTTFEAITVLAFVYFVQQQVDFAVIEVGLGGRLDATNVITPQVAIITSLSLDHTYLLGNTLADIAQEKAGIIKPGIPTVCEPQNPEALAVIQQICAERGSQLTLVGREWVWHASSGTPASPETKGSLDSQLFDLCHTQDPSLLDGTYSIPLLGHHQVNNAVAAIAALDLLQRGGTPVQPHHIHQGVANVRWPGRFEILERDLPLVVDCAHNGDSVSKLVAALEDWFPGRRWTFVLGASNDKDVPGMLRALAPWTHRLLATQSSHPRAMPSKQVAELASEILAEAGAPLVEITATSDVGSALNLALRGSDSEHGAPNVPQDGEQRETGEQVSPICVTGSIFVVADAREVWALHTGSALPETDHQIAHALLPLGQNTAPQIEAMALERH